MRTSVSDDNRRDLQFFLAGQELASLSVDADEGNGELSILIPESCKEFVKKDQPLIVSIEFCLEDPKGGIRFNAQTVHKSGYKDFYLATIDHNPHYWFPCVNSYNELCTWKIEVVVEEDMSVIASGSLIEIEDLGPIEVIETDNNQDISESVKYSKYHYFLKSPTSAPNIGLVVGCFDTFNDENINDVSFHYYSSDLFELVKQTTSCLNEIFDFYEDIFSFQFQNFPYKQVFIHNLFDNFISFTGLTILNVNLLHPNAIIEQAIETKKQLSKAIVQQFFGTYLTMNSISEWWLVNGLASFFSGLYLKKLFGNNEYKYMLYEKMKKVCLFEREQGLIVLDFNYTGLIIGKENLSKATPAQYSFRYHLIGSPTFFKVAEKKAHLVVRLIDDSIGHDVMVQIVNKLLTQASNCVGEKGFTPNCWSSFLVSIETFNNTLNAYSTKDIKNLLDLWVYKPGFARLNTSMSFNRKKNTVEIEIKQDMANQRGYRKYVGPITIIIQEIDGSFTHNLQIEDSLSTKFDIACHSKGKKNKKKKVVLITGEEVDIDSSQLDSDSPILWIRMDSDLKILREIKLEQPDIHWQHQVRYERDICAQLDAVEQLPNFANMATRTCLTSVLENNECFYRIRMQAAYALAQVANKMVHNWNGPLPLISTFKKLYMTTSGQSIVNANNFNDLQGYFIQKNIPIAMGSLRTSHNLCPSEIIRFLIDLIKYNENSKNTFSDCYYKAALLDALNSAISASVASLQNDLPKSANLTPDTRLIIEEIVLRMNLEKIVPSYRYLTTSSCLKAIRNLQKLGHIPEDIDLFKQYADYSITYEEVRLVAFEIIVEYLAVRNDEALLDYIFDFIEFDPSYNLKQHIIHHLCKYPPFKMNSDDTSLNNENLVNKIWKLLNKFSYNNNLLASMCELYCTLYGMNKPKCLKHLSKETYKGANFLAPVLD